MKEPNLAVVGAGYWGKNLVRNFTALGALHTVCDPDPASRERLAAQYPEVHYTGDLTGVLGDPAIERVAIATPAVAHHAHACAALDAGKDVFVEKPLALTVREGADLVQRAEALGKILMVGHVLHYHPAIEKLQEIVRRGELGALRYVYSNRLNLGKVRTEENILWSFAPHDISIMLGLVGTDPVRVAASGATYITEGVPDVTVSQLSFPGGVRGHIFVSWLHPYKEQRLVVVGERKMAVFDDTLREGKLRLHDKGIDVSEGAPVPRHDAETTVELEDREPLLAECQEFLDACAERRPPLTDGENGLRVLRVLAACQASIEKDGEPIAIEAAG